MTMGMYVSRGTQKRNGHAVQQGPTQKKIKKKEKDSSEFTVQVSQAFLAFNLKSQTPKMSRNTLPCTLLLLKLKLKH